MGFYHVPLPAEYFSAFSPCLGCWFGVAFLYAGSLWFLFIVEVPPCGWGWTIGLSRFPSWGSLHLCSGGWYWISSLWSAMKCPVVSFEVSMCLVWLLAVYIFVISIMFLHCWRISLVCLALKLIGSWVELGFSVGMEAFGWALVDQCSLQSGVFWCSQVLDLSPLPLAFSFILTVASRLLHPYSTDDKTSRLMVEQFSTVWDT